MSEPKWYEAEKTNVRGHWLEAPYQNVFIGCRPTEGMRKEVADSFDAIVNVSTDAHVTFEPSRPDQRTYWYPVVECGEWSYGYLCWLVQVLNHHHNLGHKIYLHCYAGAFRSPSAALLWLRARGHTESEALRINKDKADDTYFKRHWQMQGNLKPGAHRMLEILKEQPDACPEAMEWKDAASPWDRELTSGHIRKRKLLRYYFPWYFNTKYAIQKTKTWIKEWFQGKGWIVDGCATYYYKRAKFWSLPNRAEPEAGYSDTTWAWDSNTKTFSRKDGR